MGKLIRSRVFTFVVFASLSCTGFSRNSFAQAATWPTHSHDAQHSGVSTVAAQSFSKIHWHTPVDLDPPQGEIFIHCGSPVITAANTVIVPVKTGNNSFRVEGHSGATGARIWALNTAYKAPSAGFMPGLGPTLFGSNLYTPDTAGGVTARTNPDSATGSVSHVYFYGQANYQADPTLYQKNVQTNTPLTPDAAGNFYFGFLILGSTPIGLQSGLARIAANGTGTWVAAANMSTDSKMTQVATSCAPALSTDGSTLYVVITNGSYGYLVSLNSTTLAPISQVRLKDPSSGLDAGIPDESSAAPTVGPDGDVYFGVLENPFPDHNDRGWMLHFSSDLSQTKIPGSFGWDDTASIVDASLVASYHGTSTYLIMTKYNNYADINTGDGKNKIAILDPNATENDPVIPTTLVMKEVITQLGVTPDPGAGMPGAVKEWCINTAAVDPIGKVVIANSEDGYIYRWDLTLNKLTKRIKLSSGIGEAYTPTLIGSDGTVYGINDAILDAIGQ
jgi:hypothetical protein